LARAGLVHLYTCGNEIQPRTAPLRDPELSFSEKAPRSWASSPARGAAGAAAQSFNLCFVVRKGDGVVVGKIGYSLADYTARLGYSIVEACQRQGTRWMACARARRADLGSASCASYELA